MDRNGGVQGKILVFENGNLENTIETKRRGTSSIITDEEKGLSYIGYAVQPASYNSDGRPYTIFKDDKEVKQFALKGDCTTYTLDKSYIYCAVDATMMGYTGVPDHYLAKINRDTQQTTIIASDIRIPSSMTFNYTDNKLYALVKKDEKSVAIDIYDTNGKLEKEVNVDLPFGNEIFIAQNGVVYVSFGHMVFNSEINCVASIDLNTGKAITKINTLKGPYKMSQVDNYLFVCNFQSDSISIIDTKANELIGNIENITGNRLDVSGMVVIKQ